MPKRRDGDTMTDADQKAALDAAMFRSEAEFQGWLKLRADEFGWLYQHNGDSRRSDPGFPDTVLVRDGRLIFAELKTEKKTSKVSSGQLRWLDELGAVAHVEAYLWRPRDIDRILETLI